jgi:hypothetical protein
MKKDIIRIHLLITIILNVIFYCSVLSQSDADSTYKNNILPSPSFTYAPETDVVIGLFALYQFKFKKSDRLTRPSHLTAYLSTSFNNQVTAGFEHNILVPTNDSYYFKGLLEFKIWPEMYYGIGPYTQEEDLIFSEYSIVRFEEQAYKNLVKKIFVGLQVKYFNYYNVSFTDTDGNEIAAPDDLTGSDGGHYLGLGIGFLKDERNSILTPITDYYFEFSSHFYGENLGSSTSFSSFLLDGRKYLNFNSKGKHVLAFQGKVLLTTGDVPFIEYAKLGGKYIMRGYVEGRYRDKQYIELQAEYRAKIIGRFGGTLFAGTGNVMPNISEFDFGALKAAVGFGLRFNINRKDPANVRIDFGYGFEKDAKGVYITFGEAF